MKAVALRSRCWFCCGASPSSVMQATGLSRAASASRKANSSSRSGFSRDRAEAASRVIIRLTLRSAGMRWPLRTGLWRNTSSTRWRGRMIDSCWEMPW
ncbi:hypothetical protein D3C85_352120 [compost metagenome]